MFNALTSADMRFRNGREPLLILPEQGAHVSHGDREDRPGGTDTQRQGEGRPEEDVTVARDNAARHTRYQDIDQTGHDLLVRLAGRGKGSDGGGEGLLEVEGAGHAGVHGIFGGAGLLVEEEAGAADLSGKSVCRGGTSLAEDGFDCGRGGGSGGGRGYGFLDGGCY